jgi:hypothetical protein
VDVQEFLLRIPLKGLEYDYRWLFLWISLLGTPDAMLCGVVQNNYSLTEVAGLKRLASQGV